jgi:hypothetical protein
MPRQEVKGDHHRWQGKEHQQDRHNFMVSHSVQSSSPSSRLPQMHRHRSVAGSGRAAHLPLRRLPRRRSSILAAKAFARRRALAFSAGVAAQSLARRRSASSLSWSLMARVPTFSTLYNWRTTLLALAGELIE